MGRKKLEAVHKIIVECAKREFLSKGFEAASLRTIAKEAGVSTSCIYARFKNKAGLFDEIVQPIAEEMKEIVRSSQNRFLNLDADEQIKTMMSYSNQEFPQILDYIYDHYQEIKLLVSCSYGTPYANFIHDLAVIDTECYKNYIKAVRSDCFTEGKISDILIHLLSSGFYSSVLELVIHDVSREEAMKEMELLRKFYSKGWLDIL